MVRVTACIERCSAWEARGWRPQANPPPPPPPPPPAQANPPPTSGPAPQGPQYSSDEIIDAGHRFFGTISRGLAQIVEKAGSQFGLPNGYVLGQEAGGAVVAGLRYGEGILYTKNAGDLRVFWQGPSLPNLAAVPTSSKPCPLPLENG
jgi:hypothetical protein